MTPIGMRFLGWLLGYWSELEDGDKSASRWDEEASRLCTEEAGLSPIEQSQGIAELERREVFASLDGGNFEDFWLRFLGAEPEA